MFEGWGDYFFMLGSSAGALVGLMFVVVTLTAGRGRSKTEDGKRLYTSPVVWHLGTVLVVSGGTIVPKIPRHFFGAVTGGIALLSIAMCMRSAYGIGSRNFTGKDTLFDVVWYGVAPALVHATLAAGALGVFRSQNWGVPVIAAALMALLLVSIHAEWDLVTFLAPIAQPPGGETRNDS